MATRQNTERVKQLRRECTKKGIRYVNRISSISKLQTMLENSEEWRLKSYARYWDLEPFDFRGKGIEPKPGAWIRWRPKRRDERPMVRGHGRFVSWDGPDHAIVRYEVYTGSGYKSRKVRIERFQIVDYREDK